MIQIRGGKSALWWEQKRQMSGGKCIKLGGGKCAEGKWYIAWYLDDYLLFEFIGAKTLLSVQKESEPYADELVEHEEEYCNL